MVLSDRSILEELAAGRIVIDPLDRSSIQPSSVDLHVDRYFRVFRNHTMGFIDVKQDQEDLTELVEVGDEDVFILHPGEFVLGSTAERVSLPDDLVARLEGKSSLGRLGLLIHSSLPAGERVLVLDDDGLFPRPIEEIVGKRTAGCVVGFDPETFAVGYHQITGWFEGPPDRIFEVLLASGRSVRVTAGHNLFTLDREGRLRKIRTGELTRGVQVAIPREIPDPPVEGSPVLRVLDLAPEAAYSELTLSGPTIAQAFDQHRRAVFAALVADGFRHTDYYLAQARLPVKVARQVAGLVDQLGQDDRISVRGARGRGIPAVIPVGVELAWLLGLYVAEGCRRHHQVTISNTDQAILDRAQNALAALGVPVYRAAGAVTTLSAISSHLVDWLDAGSGARHKQVPARVFGWPRPLLDAFFEGLVDGIGQPDLRSSRLADDLLYLDARRCQQASPNGGLLWDRVVEVRDTGRVEPIYDLEVRPAGRAVENFLAGTGGVFVSNTAGFVDAGWDGHLTLELSNVANLPITIYPGMKIGQISFLRMTTPAETPYGSAKAGSKYQGQRGPTPSRYFENFRPRG